MIYTFSCQTQLKFTPIRKATLKPTMSTKSIATFTAEPTNQTFLVHSIYNKPARPARSDIYNTSFEGDCADADAANQMPELTAMPKSSTMYDIRRQTCIIGSPRINREGKFVSVQFTDELATSRDG